MLIKPLAKLQKLLEAKPSRAEMVQGIHDHSVSMGASCQIAEAASFGNNDAYTLLLAALKEKMQAASGYNYPYIADVFDTYLVYSNGYDGDLFRCNYDVTDDGAVTLGDPVAVIRKTQYIDKTTETETTTESDLESDPINLIEANADLTEATRVVKLIAPGWGSSGYYSPDVLKRDGPNVFKAGLHNYIDHPTPIEERDRPEGTLTRLGSTLLEDAKWYDDFNGNGPGLYSKASISDDFAPFLAKFAPNIGMSIRARGDTHQGLAEGKSGKIVDSISSAKSIDYVTRAGAGGKVLDLIESQRSTQPEKEQTPMADTTNLEETIKSFNRRFVRNDANTRIAAKITPLKLSEAIKARITERIAMLDTPLTESGDQLDTVAFDVLIEATVKNELDYLSSIGALGQIKDLGESTPKEPIKLEDAQKTLQEALAKL